LKVARQHFTKIVRRVQVKGKPDGLFNWPGFYEFVAFDGQAEGWLFKSLVTYAWELTSAQ